MADEQAASKAKPVAGESAAAGGTLDVTAGWFNGLHRANQDPVLRSRGGDLAVYEELIRDDAVFTAFQQRQLALIGKPLRVLPGADDPLSKAAAEDLETQLKGVNFDAVTTAMLFGRIMGYAVAECLYELKGKRWAISKIKVRRARRFLFAADGSLLLKTRAQPQGQALPSNKFWTYTSDLDVTDDPYGFGLGQVLFWLVWFKRNDVRLWLTALDKNASPTTIGRFTEGAPVEDQNKLLAALVALRSNSAAVFPKGFDVTQLEGKTGAGDYQALYTALDDTITRVIVGQTMTSRSGSSEAQARVHQDVKQEIVEADDDLLCGSFNVGPARWITAGNFPGAATPIVTRREEEVEDLVQQTTIDRALIEMGYDPTDEYIQATYGAHWTRRAGGNLGFGAGGDEEAGDV